MPPSVPPNSFWILGTSSTRANFSLKAATNDSITLVTEVWHCLPGKWRSAAKAAVEAERRQSVYSQLNLEIHDPE